MVQYGRSTQEPEQVVGREVPGVEQVRRLFAKQNLHDVPAARVNEIPVRDRLTALQDLHGASDTVEESSELLDEALIQLNALMESPSQLVAKEVSPKQREAYYSAFSQNKAYVEKWKIRFVRAEQFDVEKAAIRMFRYFDSKLSLFGNKEILARDIRRADFDQNYDDKLGVDKGIFHLLPDRDRAGRAIIFINPTAAGRSMYPMGSLLRIFFWIASIAAGDDEDVQRRGFVLVWFGLKFEFDGKISECGNHYFSLFPSLPLRINSVHCCYQDPRMTFYFSFLGRTIASAYLLQFQSHLGTHLECRYNLMTFGIPASILPIDVVDGKIHNRDYERLMARVAKMESASSQGDNNFDSENLPGWICKDSDGLGPGPKDIVMGRGSAYKRGSGYAHLKKLLEKHYDKYYKVSRFEKTVISRMIYEEISESGSRFMAKKGSAGKNGAASQTGWKVLGEDDARGRIAHAFRNLRQLKG